MREHHSRAYESGCLAFGERRADENVVIDELWACMISDATFEIVLSLLSVQMSL